MKKFFKNFLITIFVMIVGFSAGGVGIIVKNWEEHSLVVTMISKDIARDVKSVFEFGDDEFIFVETAVSLPLIPKRTRPRVIIAPSVMEEMMMIACEKRRIEDEKQCEEYSQEYGGVGRPTVIKCNITTFAGRKDTGVKWNETGSVSLERLRSADINQIATAWPMPEMNENNPESPWNLPSVEEYLGGGHSKLSKRIEVANKSLRDDYYAEISYYHPILKEVIKVYAVIVDRGPNVEMFEDLPRWDGYLGLWVALKLEDKLKNPNDKNNQVELVVRLVRKDKVDAERKSEELFTQVKLEDVVRFYGPQGEFESDHEQFSTNESEMFALPLWGSDKKPTTIASNP